ncbi:MAG: hypothetical protein RMK89_09690 [Armatimonadota bacterium]|nr:hypothetical protein [Armatimonadota bacterium]MDW8143719.1 hypothetical protein [Armatimonadota bacterium]
MQLEREQTPDRPKVWRCGSSALQLIGGYRLMPLAWLINPTHFEKEWRHFCVSRQGKFRARPFRLQG